jgi:hypothetical protein
MRIYNLRQAKVGVEGVGHLLADEPMQSVNTDSRTTLVRVAVIVANVVKEIAVVENANSK